MLNYKGLTSEEACKRLKEEGENTLEKPAKRGALGIFAGQFRDVMVMVLLGATAVSAVMGEIYDAVTIIAIVILDAVLGFIQEYRTERTVEALERMSAPSARVIRDGKEQKIEARELVRGDIFLLSEGDRVPADGKILEEYGLRCDEAVLTGESGGVKKAVYSGEDILSPSEAGLCYAGTAVLRGNAVCETVLTGMKTQMGKVSGLIGREAEQKTPLQKKLGKLGTSLCVICLLVCALVTAAGILRGEPLFDMLMTGITIAIAAIPEGLPATVTIALALAVRRTVRLNALVNKLHSVETLGCTNVICTDKTGTLTENVMSVTEIYAAGEEISLTGSGYSTRGKVSLNGETLDKLPEHARHVLELAAVCCNAKITPYEREESSRERKTRGLYEAEGDPTEAAILIAAEKCGVTSGGAVEGCVRISEIPFDHESKKMTVRYRRAGREFTAVKGAPDVIISQCRSFCDRGEIRRLDTSAKNSIISKYENMAKNGQREFSP